MKRMILLAAAFICSAAYWSCSAELRDESFCDSEGRYTAIRVTAGDGISIYDTNPDYSPLAKATVEGNAIGVSYEENDLTTRPGDYDLGYRPHIIKLSWSHGGTPIVLTLDLKRYESEDEIVSDISISQGEIVQPESPDYKQVIYGNGAITLDNDQRLRMQPLNQPHANLGSMTI